MVFHIIGYLRFLYWLIHFLSRGHNICGNKTYLMSLYKGFLQRDIDSSGLFYYHNMLLHKTLTRKQIIQEILSSEEYNNKKKEFTQYVNVKIITGLFLFDYWKLIVTGRNKANNIHFVSSAYRFFLKRQPDPDGLKSHLNALAQHHCTKSDIIETFTGSLEFKRIHSLPIDIMEAQHLSRIEIVRQYLPPAEYILDLGGAAHHFPEGALRAMGYPYRPIEITIIDLPPEERIGGTIKSESVQKLTTRDNVIIRYLYRSMADLSDVKSNSIDLVVSGESIEHVSEEDADTILQETYRILQPGGHLCLDTPNAGLTRLQSPDTLIHPEHHKEYYVYELESKLVSTGFDIVERKGISPMPQSYHRGIFDYHELATNVGVCDTPEHGYMFFIKAVKPFA